MTRTALLLHAYPLSAAMWARQEDALRASGLEVVAPHLPGFGGRPGQMGSLADTARALLDEVPPEPVALVGLSMGGYLALELLAQAPGRFGRVVLADTTARADTDERRRDRLAQAARVRIEGRGFILEAAEQEHPAATFVQVKPMIEAATPDGIAAALEAMAARADHRDTLRALRVPLLVLVGEQDEITPRERAEELAELGRGELAVLPGAGHLSNLDQPQVFNAALTRFLT